MIVKTDTFIEIGSQHQMCEDYIISAHNFIILADGCSSADHSEMGARFLSYMAREFLIVHEPRPDQPHYLKMMPNWIIHHAENISKQLGLKLSCLDATLIISYIIDKTVHIHMYGDGSVILQTGDDEYTMFEVDYKAGSRSMPYYLRYTIDVLGHESYHDAKVTKTVSTHRVLNQGPVQTDIREMAYDNPCQFSFPLSDYRSISIASDGLSSFLKVKPDEDGNKILKASEMVPFIFDFKNSPGVFLQRQMNICKRKLKKSGLQFDHFDDLSIGTYLIEDNQDGRTGNET